MPRPRLVLLSALLAVSSITACEKKTTLVVPDEGAGGQGAPAATEQIVLRYGPGAKTLRQKASMETTTNGGGQFVEAKVDFTAKLAVTEQAGKLKVAWAIDGVDEVSVSGALQGQGQGDPKAFLTSTARGAYLTDLQGRTDAAVSDTLPENQAMQQKLEQVQREVQAKTAAGEPPQYPAGADVLPYLQPVIQLPTLPEQGLEVGKAMTIEKEEERDLASVGVVLPLSIATTYTLVRVDGSGSTRIAEVQFSGEAGGQAQGQVGTVTITSEYEGTLLFDLDQAVPVSYDVTRTESWNLGPVTGETTTVIKATWELG